MSEKLPVAERIQNLEQQLEDARWEQAGRPADVNGVLEDVNGNRPVLAKDADIYFERERRKYEEESLGVPDQDENMASDSIGSSEVSSNSPEPDINDLNAVADDPLAAVVITPEALRAAIIERVRGRSASGVGAGLLGARGVEDITKSFDRPVINLHPRSSAQKLGMQFDDIRDNLDYELPPYTAEYTGPESMKLLERLLPEEAVSAIRRIGANYYRGIFRRKDTVGDQEKGTNHPHIYFLDTTKPGVTRMFFVDPEDKVAVNDRLRPSIVNLVGVEVPDNKLESPQVVVMRYKIPKYEYGVKQDGRNPEELRTVIAEVLDKGGELPAILSGDLENQVLFMIASDTYSSRVQARYSTKRQIESFARGEKGSSALEGKVLTQELVVDKLIRLFYQRSEVREMGKSRA